jgi:hypothetical protein
LTELEPDPAKSAGLAQTYFWDAQIMISMAEVFSQTTFEGGPPNTPVETLNMAIAILDEGLPKAMAVPLNADYIAAFHGLKARAERQKFYEPGGSQANLTQAAAFAASALAAKSTFIINARYVPPGKTNGVYNTFGPGRGFTPLGVQEVFGAGWRDPVSNQLDPRTVNAMSAKLSSGPQGDLYYLTKYATNGTSIPVIRWQEMKLIQAEERLAAGDLGAAVARINEVRPTALGQFASTDAAQIRAQILYERQTEFFAEGRNWQDLRNYDVIPVKWNAEARSLGIDRRIPISPQEMQTNPNF